MKKLILAVALCVAAACSNSNVESEKTEEREILCGGYTGQREITAEEMDMFIKVVGADVNISSL